MDFDKTLQKRIDRAVKYMPATKEFLADEYRKDAIYAQQRAAAINEASWYVWAAHDLQAALFFAGTITGYERPSQ